MFARYQPILGVPVLRRLLVSSVIGRLPLGTCTLAVLLLVRAATHSYATAGLAVGALAAAEAVCAPPLGRWLDRVGVVRVVAMSASVQSAALVLIALAGTRHGSAVLLVLLSAVIGAGMPPVGAAARSLWSRLLSDAAERDSSFALDAIGQELVWTTGPVIVGVVSAGASPRVAALMVAAVTLLSSLWFIRAVGALELDPVPVSAAGATGGRARIIRILTPVTVLFGVSLGGIEVSLPALAGHVSHPSLSGVLLAIWSVGSMAGGITFGLRHWAIPRHRLLPWLLFTNALLVVPVMLSGSLAVAAVACFFAGVCIAPVFSSLSSLIGEHAPAGALAGAFTWNTAAIVIGASAGSAVCGEIISSAGLVASYAVAGGAGLVGGMLALSLGVTVPRLELSGV